MATAIPAFKRTKRYWLWPAASLLLQVAIAIALYQVVEVSENGQYEFPVLASHQRVVWLLGTLGGISLLLGIISTYVILRHYTSYHKWLWLLLCCLPVLFMGCLYIHFMLMIQAVV